MVTALEEELRNDVEQANSSEPTSIPLRGILSNMKTSSFRQLGVAQNEVTLGPPPNQPRLSHYQGNVNVVLGHTAFD